MRRISLLIAALLLFFSGLTAQASAESSQAQVTGQMPSPNGAVQAIGLCSVRCFYHIGQPDSVLGKAPDGTIITDYTKYYGTTTKNGDTSGSFVYVTPQAGSYRIAVNYNGGSFFASGYLKEVTGGYVVTTDWAAATLFAVPAEGDLGTLTIFEKDPGSGGGGGGGGDPVPTYAVHQIFSFTNGDSAVTPAFTVGLCTMDCFTAGGDIDASQTGSPGSPLVVSGNANTGELEFSAVPEGSYLVAVSVPSLSRYGYVTSSGAVERLVRDSSTADWLPVHNVVSSDYTIAFGDWNPTYPATTWTASAVMLNGSFSHFNITVFKGTTDTTVTVRVIGCGGATVAQKTRSDAGTYSFPLDSDPRHMGKNWKLQATISRPGYDTHVTEMLKFAGLKGNFTCPLRPVPTAWVKTWSHKVGAPVAGHRVRITRTVLNSLGRAHHARVSYSWVAGKRVVGHRLSLRLRPSLLGKPLAARVVVSHKGMRPHLFVLRFGRVHR